MLTTASLAHEMSSIVARLKELGFSECVIVASGRPVEDASDIASVSHAGWTDSARRGHVEDVADRAQQELIKK